MFDFPVTVESIDVVPEEFRFLYELNEGENATGATLIAPLKKRVEVGAGASKALEIERRSKLAAESAAKAWKAKVKELLEVDTVEAMTEAFEALKTQHATDLEAARTTSAAGGNKDAEEAVKRQIDQVKAEKDREWSKKLAAAEAATKKAEERTGIMQRSLDKHMRKQMATAAIAAHKGRVKVLEPHVMGQLKLIEESGEWDVRVVDDAGDERFDSEGKHMTPEQLVAQMKSSDEFGFAFEGDGATGSGSRSPTGGGARRSGTNPWSKKAGTWNVTEQAKLLKTNAGLAKQLQAQAEAEARAA